MTWNRRELQCGDSCSDYYNVYGKYRIGAEYYFTKWETALVESKNSQIRHYLVRFNRKNNRYSKAFDMIANPLTLIFYQQLISTII